MNHTCKISIFILKKNKKRNEIDLKLMDFFSKLKYEHRWIMEIMKKCRALKNTNKFQWVKEKLKKNYIKKINYKIEDMKRMWKKI